MSFNSRYLAYAFSSLNSLLDGQRLFLSNDIMLALLATDPDRYALWMQVLENTPPEYLDPYVHRVMRLHSNNLCAVADHLDRFGFRPTPV